MSIADQQFTATYDVITANEELAKALNVDLGAPLLRRRWVSTDPKTDRLLSMSVCYIPKSFVESNPALLDASNEPWPGGTMHQLSTVGIEIMRIVDEVTARMPTSTEARAWDMPSGIPLLVCRRISYDADGRTIEISDAEYPADRTELRFITPLKPWPTSPEGRSNSIAQQSRPGLPAPGYRHLPARSEDQGKTPFGALVVVGDEIVGEGTSSVVELLDPSAHAEIMALRSAAAKLQRHLIDDGTLYSSSEPCPMCLTACYWARIPRVVFGATSYDVATYGFEDLQLYRELARPPDQRSLREDAADQRLRSQAADVLRTWADEYPEPIEPKY